MKKQIFLAAAVILFIGNSLPANVTVELPLDCAGDYSGGDTWSANFDLGVTFTDISHVYIDWEGEITAGRAIHYTRPDEPFPQRVGIGAAIEKPFPWRYTDVWGGESTYPNPEPFDICSEFVQGDMPWSELYDGKGEILIYYQGIIMNNGRYIEQGLVTINSAKLVVDGSVVPEPTSFILVSIGVIGVRLSRKKLNIFV